MLKEYMFLGLGYSIENSKEKQKNHLANPANCHQCHPLGQSLVLKSLIVPVGAIPFLA
jgi:hypothetical protein